MHMPVVVGYLVGLAQVASGLAILSGALIRLGAACIIVVTLGAIFLVHLPHGFDIRRGGIEYALTQLLIFNCAPHPPAQTPIRWCRGSQNRCGRCNSLPGGAQSGGLSTTQSSRHRRVALLLATAYLLRYSSDSYTCATLGSNSFSGKSCTVVTAHGCKDDRDSICSACVQPGAALRTKESIRLSLEKL